MDRQSATQMLPSLSHFDPKANSWYHMRDWVSGTADDDWVSMATPSDGSYGAPEGIITSTPCTTAGGRYQVVQGLDIDDFSRGKIEVSWAELVEERDAVEEMGLLG